MAEGDFLEISAVWKNTSKNGKVFYSGSLGKTKIFLFEVESSNEKAPAFRICLAARQEDEEGGYQKKGSQGNQDNAFSKKEPDMDRTDDGPPDSEIPF